jgi:hypothetical protein
MQQSNRYAFVLVLACVVACGKPMDPSGKEDATFTKASMGGTPPTGPDRPLAADLAVVAVEKLVTDNRIKNAEGLAAALNKTPGQFSHLDLDKDGAPDPLGVVKPEVAGGHAFEIRVRPKTGEFVVATMKFTQDWEYEGHYDGTTKFASTVGRPLPVATATPAPPAPPPAPAPAPAAAGAVDPSAPPAGAGSVAAPTPPAPGTSPAPAPAVAGSVQAVPAGSEAPAGVKNPAAP